MSKNRQTRRKIVENHLKKHKKCQKLQKTYNQKCPKNEKIPTKKSKNRGNINKNFEKLRRNSKNRQKCQKNDKNLNKL